MNLCVVFYFLLSVALGGVVEEFPFGTLNESDIEVSSAFTSDNDSSIEIIAESTESLMDVFSDPFNSTAVEELMSNTEVSPILKVIRNFLFQARDGLLEPLVVTDKPMDERTEKVLKFLEQGLFEATTMLMNEMETASTVSSQIERKDNVQFMKRKGEFQESDMLTVKNKRESNLNMMANMSTTCSNCYTQLQTCVQQCFVQHNCHDLQRSVRACPPVPNRLCNPFSPWTPVDECHSHHDCRSPNLCCNDGCINRCTPGMWRN